MDTLDISTPTIPETSRSASLNAAIDIRHLCKTYPGDPEIRAVDGIDLTVTRGEMFGLLGPNGAGKTTTVGMCTTRVKPTSGQAIVDGVDVVADPPRVKRRIGVVTQFNTLDRSCTVYENLYFHCRFFGMPHRESRERSKQLLKDFRLAEREKATPRELSGGMAQRLQIARAIAHRPDVLFLDEPTAGLDPQSRIALWDIVEQMREQEGITVLLTTHYIEEADQLCDRVAIIDHGKILVCDTPDDLKRNLKAGTVVKLRLDGDAGDLPTVLLRLNGVISAETTADGVTVMANHSNGLLPHIVEMAQDYGLRDISVTDPTLETVFIDLTGRDLRE
ncbi:MAG TPA: ABC transporter ATP-binding protein [Thermomicrobiales bacterium]|nr:ABC transporter ATP-binding protein [Thermomicrobiales bacterium]